MRLLNKTQITLKRHYGDGYWLDDGTWVEGGLQSTTIRGSVQPAFKSGIYQKTLPEGVRQKDCRDVYTKTELIEGSEKEQINSDYLVINGLEYEVYEVQEWWGAKGLSHYNALVIRRDKLDDGS